MTKGPKHPSTPRRLIEEAQPKPSFQFRYMPDAGRDIKDLDGSIRNQIRNVLEKKLAVDPEGYGLPLHGPLTNYWKHEFGSHRVIYRIYPEHHIVVVCAVGARKQGDAKDIYRQLESVAKTGRLAGQVASVLKQL